MNFPADSGKHPSPVKQQYMKDKDHSNRIKSINKNMHRTRLH